MALFFILHVSRLAVLALAALAAGTPCQVRRTWGRPKTGNQSRGSPDGSSEMCYETLSQEAWPPQESPPRTHTSARSSILCITPTPCSGLAGPPTSTFSTCQGSGPRDLPNDRETAWTSPPPQNVHYLPSTWQRKFVHVNVIYKIHIKRISPSLSSPPLPIHHFSRLLARVVTTLPSLLPHFACIAQHPSSHAQAPCFTYCNVHTRHLGNLVKMQILIWQIWDRHFPKAPRCCQGTTV